MTIKYLLISQFGDIEQLVHILTLDDFPIPE